MRNIQKYTAALLSTVMILSLLLTGCSGRKDDGTVTITNVSYDPTREFYEKYNKIFESYYESEHGKKINVIQSHGGSGAQARSVVEGCNADVVTLALEHDIDLIQNTGLIDKGWIDEFSDSSAPYTSTIVLLVRNGNPKHISDWDDLVKKNVDMIAYYDGDPKRIQHFTKVHSYARLIGIGEELDDASLFILEAAAYTHDIGIRVAEEKYGRCMDLLRCRSVSY